jgi:nucleotide-binding universal stress UspA family protein
MKRILVCLDASPRAPLVLEAAADLGRRLGAKLCLLRSVGLPTSIDQEAVTHGASVITDLETAAKADLDGHAAKLPGQIEGVHVRIGTPWDAICHEANELDCDLVVIGSHGYKGLDKVLGTTASKVVNHCDRSVLVVRPHP